jgi:hypothetical protein
MFLPPYHIGHRCANAIREYCCDSGRFCITVIWGLCTTVFQQWPLLTLLWNNDPSLCSLPTAQENRDRHGTRPSSLTLEREERLNRLWGWKQTQLDSAMQIIQSACLHLAYVGTRPLEELSWEVHAGLSPYQVQFSVRTRVYWFYIPLYCISQPQRACGHSSVDEEWQGESTTYRAGEGGITLNLENFEASVWVRFQGVRNGVTSGACTKVHSWTLTVPPVTSLFLGDVFLWCFCDWCYPSYKQGKSSLK